MRRNRYRGEMVLLIACLKAVTVHPRHRRRGHAKQRDDYSERHKEPTVANERT